MVFFFVCCCYSLVEEVGKMGVAPCPTSTLCEACLKKRRTVEGNTVDSFTNSKDEETCGVYTSSSFNGLFLALKRWKR